MHRSRHTPLITVVILTLAASAATLAKRGITAEDYLAFEFINDAHISPDGKQVAYVVTTIDQKRNRRNASIWVVAVDGNSAARRLTAETASSNSPRWSPDGSRLAFLSSRATQAVDTAAAPATEAPRPQICGLRTDRGEGQVLAHLKNGVQL